MMSTQLLRLAINRIPMLRPHEKLLLEEIVDSESFFCSLSVPLLAQITGRSLRDASLSPAQILDAASRDQEFIRTREIGVLSVVDDRYPAQLREIYDPPYLLYIRGTVPEWTRPSVAIVGTREPTAGALVAARELGAGVARAGLAVVSGLARGIDVAAHLGALGHGVTGAVLACGIDQVCPSSHRRVAAQILARGGFLLGEYAPGVLPQKYHFPARNRIISGLSRGVVVVQAPGRSGALITAEYALDHGRDLFVHSAGIDGPTGAGTADLAADGALIISGANDILAEWGLVSDASGAVDEHQSGTDAVRTSAEVAHSVADRTRADLELELRRYAL